jgi:hypothetical protein
VWTGHADGSVFAHNEHSFNISRCTPCAPRSMARLGSWGARPDACNRADCRWQLPCSQDAVRALAVDTSSQLWVGTDAGELLVVATNSHMSLVTNNR